MLLALKRWIATRLQRALGLDEIQKQLNRMEAAARRQALLVGNAAWLAGRSRDTIEPLPAYRRAAALLARITPRAVEGASLVRLGGPNDGGYVMLEPVAPPIITAAYSFGVGHDISWDAAIAARGIDVWLYDHTVSTPPGLPPRCQFVRKAIAGKSVGPDERTLAECIAENGHAGRRDLLLKLDVEGAEWGVLESAPETLLCQFQQIVVEFHGLADAVGGDRHEKIVAVLDKLTRTHQCVHVHGNCDQPPVWLGDLVVPDVAEVTYVRRSDVAGRLGSVVRSLPMELDAPNNPGWPEIPLRFPAAG